MVALMALMTVDSSEEQLVEPMGEMMDAMMVVSLVGSWDWPKAVRSVQCSVGSSAGSTVAPMGAMTAEMWETLSAGNSEVHWVESLVE